MKKLSLGAAFAAFVALPLLAHDGDLKLLHRQPSLAGPGFRNISLNRIARADELGPNGQMAMTMFASNRVTLLSWLTLDDFGVGVGGNGNSLWGYTAPSGRRYALMGHSNGTSFVEISQPNNPVILNTIAGPNSLWRDIRTYQDHAYAVSEGGGGIQVFDLSLIDSGVVSLVNTIDDDGTSDTHTVCIDETSGFLYRSGGSSTDGLRIYSLANPASPARVGTWSDRYVHEVSVFTLTTGPLAGEQIAFACGGFNGGFDSSALHIVNVSDKSNPVLLNIVTYPGVDYCHQGWLSEDEQYFYINDEFFDGTSTTHVIDVSNPADGTFVSSFTNGNNSVAHNVYTYNGHMYASNYKSGLRVWDLANPTNPTEVAWFDTAPEDDARTYNSLWNNYPYFGDGLVIGSDIEKGLFVWFVGDPLLTFNLPAGAPTLVDPAGESVTVQINEFVPGDYMTGTAMLHYDTGSGYVSVPMTDQGGLTFQADFPPMPCGSQVDYYFSAQSDNNVVWTEPNGAPFVLFQATAAAGLTTIAADDFQTDQGWTPSNLGASSGNWQRGVPVDDPGWDYDPSSDSDGSGSCYLTENASGNTDVDGGAVQLLSPAIDMSQGISFISYDYYLNLTDDDGTDALAVEINSNNGSGSWTEIARHSTDGGTSWRNQVVTDTDLAGLGVTLTSTMRLRFTANDGDAQSIVEAGLDALLVQDLVCNNDPVFCAGDGTGPACPCGNNGNPGHGCENSAGTGGLELSSTGDPALNNVVLVGTGYPVAGSPSAIVIRSTQQHATMPFFGDGILCINPPTVRLSASTGIGGTSSHPINHGAGPGTFYYQLWYRNTGGFCTPSPFNMSNGYTLVYP